MSEEQLILQRKFPITSRHADFKSELRISSLINDYIQIAWQHAEELGLGYLHLKEQGLGWVCPDLHSTWIIFPNGPEQST